MSGNDRSKTKAGSREEKLDIFLSGNVGKDSSILTQLASQVIDKLVIRTSTGNRIFQWNNRVTRYFRSPYSTVAKNHKDISQARNNLNRALAKKSVTWKNFMEVIRIAGAKRVVFKIEFTDHYDRVHRVSTEIINHYSADDFSVTEMEEVKGEE